MVSAHVDYLCGLLYAPGMRLPPRLQVRLRKLPQCGLWLLPVNVEEANPLYGTNSVGYSLDFFTVASFAEIGDAFNDTCIHDFGIDSKNYVQT